MSRLTAQIHEAHRNSKNAATRLDKLLARPDLPNDTRYRLALAHGAAQRAEKETLRAFNREVRRQTESQTSNRE